MRLVWTTDPHLNHVSSDRQEQWIKQIASHGADGVVISGDISEGDDVVLHLNRLALAIAVPIYFVLGNHDFYQSLIGTTRRSVICACRENRHLHYLTDASSIPLGRRGVFLVGDDGWGDATVGDYEHSTIQLNDFRLIKDFQIADRRHWKRQLQDLGTESARRLAAKLDALPDDAKQVLVVTHVPPFREACWYQGRTTDDNWAPFFVCGRVGEILRAAAAARPGCQFTILCGHTHHRGVVCIAPNLVVHTGAADYGRPDIEALLTIDPDTVHVDRPPGSGSA